MDILDWVSIYWTWLLSLVLSVNGIKSAFNEFLSLLFNISLFILAFVFFKFLLLFTLFDWTLIDWTFLFANIPFNSLLKLNSSDLFEILGLLLFSLESDLLKVISFMFLFGELTSVLCLLNLLLFILDFVLSFSTVLFLRFVLFDDFGEILFLFCLAFFGWLTLINFLNFFSFLFIKI